jgi:hypothetical protein
MPLEFRQIPEATIDAVEEPSLRALFDHWQRIRGSRTVPLRANFDPLDVPLLLKDLFLVEVHGREPPWRFRYRVAGTGISKFVGQDYTGRFVDEIFPPPARSIVEEFYSAPVRLRMPVYSSSRLIVPRSQVSKRVSRLVVPLSIAGQSVDMLLSGQHYDQAAGARTKRDFLKDYELESIFAVRPY